MSGMMPIADRAKPPLPDPLAFKRWLRAAKPGAKIVYARGGSLKRCDLVDEVRATHDRGEVILVQRRVDGELNYLAIRRAETAPVAPAQRIVSFTDGDDAFDRVMRCLKRAANLRRVCPTNVELAKRCGLKSADAAAYIIRCAIDRRLIRVTDRRPKRRVVRILATGRTTLED